MRKKVIDAFCFECVVAILHPNRINRQFGIQGTGELKALAKY